MHGRVLAGGAVLMTLALTGCGQSPTMSQVGATTEGSGTAAAPKAERRIMQARAEVTRTRTVFPVTEAYATHQGDLVTVNGNMVMRTRTRVGPNGGFTMSTRTRYRGTEASSVYTGNPYTFRSSTMDRIRVRPSGQVDTRYGSRMRLVDNVTGQGFSTRMSDRTRMVDGQVAFSRQRYNSRTYR